MARGCFAWRVVLVAGGAGFIGANLCRSLLAQGARVICLDSFLTGRYSNLVGISGDPNFILVEHDVVEPLPLLPRVDYIFNLACAASPPHYQADPVHTMRTSVEGTRNLLELAAGHRARLLQASTSEVYGNPQVHPQSESYHGDVNAVGPRACYDEGKRAAETLCVDYAGFFSVSVRIARIFNTYGPYMRSDDGRVVSNFVCQALLGQPLTVYGDGSQTRSFCFVSDMVRGLERLMAAAPAADSPRDLVGPVNLGNPAEFTVAELAELVLRKVRSRSPVVRRPLPKDDPVRRRPDITLAGRLLGWAPRVRLERGLADTIDWFRHDLGRRPHRLRRPAPQGRPGRVAPAS